MGKVDFDMREVVVEEAEAPVSADNAGTSQGVAERWRAELEACAHGTTIFVTTDGRDCAALTGLGLHAFSAGDVKEGTRVSCATVLVPFRTVIVGRKGEELSDAMRLLQAEVRRCGGTVQAVRWPDSIPDGIGPRRFFDDGIGNATELVELVAGKQARTALKSIDVAKAFCSEPEPVPWILDGWMAKGEIVCLAGEASVGKSLLAMQLALCLVSGRKFLGEMDVNGGPFRVMYVDEENNERLVVHRLRKIARGLGITLGDLIDDRFLYVAGNDLNFDDGGKLDAFRTAVAGFRPDVIVLDSLVRVHGQEENSNMAMASFFSRVIKKTALEYGAGFVILHHLSKPSKDRGSSISLRLRGASDLRAQIDGLWGMAAGEAGSIQFTHEKSRWDQQSPTLRLKFESRDGDRSLQFLVDEDTEGIDGALVAAIKLKGSLGATTQDLVQVLEKLGMTSGDRLLRKYAARLELDGKLVKKKTGREVRYLLPDDELVGAA